MARKLYETKEDISREKITIDFVKDKLGMGDIVKLPIKYKIDYIELGRFKDGGKSIVNFVEIKNRTVPKNQYLSLIHI